MAILKPVELDSGIVVNYHRIVSINNIINRESIIEIASYTSKAKREEEKEALKSHKAMDIFVNSKLLNLPCDAAIDVVKAYNYLKTLDEFKGAENA